MIWPPHNCVNFTNEEISKLGVVISVFSSRNDSFCVFLVQLWLNYTQFFNHFCFSFSGPGVAGYLTAGKGASSSMSDIPPPM